MEPGMYRYQCASLLLSYCGGAQDFSFILG